MERGRPALPERPYVFASTAAFWMLMVKNLNRELAHTEALLEEMKRNSRPSPSKASRPDKASPAECPCCSKTMTVKAFNNPYKAGGRTILGIHECPHCGAVFGQCYQGESYSIVYPRWQESGDFENAFYYDLTILGSDGITRSHGWADKTTRRIIQTG
jgi:hypothetical protein